MEMIRLLGFGSSRRRKKRQFLSFRGFPPGTIQTDVVSLMFNAVAPESKQVVVTSSSNWNVVVNRDYYYLLDKSTGANGDTLTVTTKSTNTKEYARDGILTFTLGNNPAVTCQVSILQNGTII